MSPLRPTPAQRALDVEKRRARNLKKKRSRQSHPVPNPFGLPPPFMPHAGFAGGHWRRKAYTKQAPFYTNPPHPHSGRGGFGGMAACPIESEAETASPFRHSSSADRWDFTGMGTEKGWPAPWRAKRGGDSPRLFYGRMKRRISGADRKCGFLRFSTGYRGHQHTLCPLYVGNGYPHRPSSAV